MQSDGAFSIAVIRRLLGILAEDTSGINKTNLASRSGLNYGACARYVELLATLRWISRSEMRGGLVFLTQTGKEFMKLLQQKDTSLVEGAEEYLSDFIMSHPNRQWLEQSANSSSSSHRIWDYSHGDDRDVSGAINIMIVEDDCDLLLTYKLYLTDHGYNVFAFSDSREALQEFAKDLHRTVDLVISDIRMKPINGIQLYRDLKSIEPSIRIMFVSALDAAPELSSALPGFRKEDLITKPADKKMFTDAVDAAIAEKRSSRLNVVSNKVASN
jgi:CheY-like chemotaxis protein/predicted transcriptional regulator